MVHLCKNCGRCHDCNCKKVVSSNKSVAKRSDTTITLRDGFELNVTRSFFDSYKKKGSIHRAKFLGTDHKKMVVKWVAGSHDCQFSKHMKYLKTGAEIMSSLLSDFKKRVDMRGWKILVVKPLLPDGPKEISLEPYVGKVEKFNTNSMWETDASRTYQKLVLGLSHFSCVASKGKHVLMNLRGSVDEGKKLIMLLAPTIVSDSPGKYGCRDLGIAGSFFKHHSCSSCCTGMPRIGDTRRKKVAEFVEL